MNALISYLRSSRAELEKVTWPTRQETLRYTAIVVVSCALFAVFLGGLDLVFHKGVEAVVSRRAVVTTQEEVPTEPVTPTVVPSGVEAVDANGKKVDLQVTPAPVAPAPATTK